MSKDKPDAWMPLYVGDWDSGTRHLDVAEDGAYGRLVRHYWKNGALTDGDASLARVVGVTLPRWRKMRPVLAAFFVIKDGLWTHNRVEAELAAWGEKRRRYIERAAAGGRAKAAKSTSKALLKGCTSASSEEVESPTGSSTLFGQQAVSIGKGKWGGPPDFREAVVARHGEAFAVAWLDPSGWRDLPDKAIVCRLEFAAERLRRDCRAMLREHGITVRTEAAA